MPRVVRYLGRLAGVALIGLVCLVLDVWSMGDRSAETREEL